MMPRASKGAVTSTPNAPLRFSPRKMSKSFASYAFSKRCDEAHRLARALVVERQLLAAIPVRVEEVGVTVAAAAPGSPT